jgi:hypothetical protein
MKSSKWLAAILPYLGVWAGLFLFKSAWLALLGFHFAIILVLIIARTHIPIKILYTTRHYKWAKRSIAACAGIGIILYWLHPYLGLAGDLSAQLESIGLNASTWPVFIAYFALVNPWIEEYFWRGYLGSELPGLSIGDLVYAGYHGLVLMGKMHLLTILLALAMLTCAGWLWRRIRRENEGLLVPILGHMAADFTILTSVYLITR